MNNKEVVSSIIYNIVKRRIEMAKKRDFVDGEKPKKPFYKKWWFWLLAIIVIGTAIDGEDDPQNLADSSSSESVSSSGESTSSVISQEESEKEESIESVVSESIESEESSLEIETPVVEFDPADYQTGLTFEDLARSPEEHKFKAVTLEGTVAQVMQGDGYTQYRLAINDDYDQMVYIEIDNAQLETRILEDDYIRVYGTYFGELTYESTLGGNITIPGIIVDKFEFL